jgi:hypothetical protein
MLNGSIAAGMCRESLAQIRSGFSTSNGCRINNYGWLTNTKTVLVTSRNKFLMF